jgi:Spy/CpxP family protein refolding chaperone
MQPSTLIAAALLAASASASAAAAAAQDSKPQVAPAGEAKAPKTRVLEAGAKLLQRNAPLAKFDIYLNGFHPMKDQPDQQVEAHHFCRQVNEDLAQCALFDGNTATANLNGIEYIISEKLFNTLPQEERRFWHPHNGEILSGQLVAPGIPEAAEHELMKKKMNSYGKTWHVWNTGANGKEGDSLPLGPAMLAWSFNRDGEMLPNLQEERDTRMKIRTAEKRKKRADLGKLARPQSGVDDLKGKFGRASQDIPGVSDSRTAAPEAR